MFSRVQGESVATANEKRMKILDLTHKIAQIMPVFPGTEPPVVELSCTIEEHGFLERKISIYSHTGTHIDAPAHMIAGGTPLDGFSVEKFLGKACVYRHGTTGRNITVQDLSLVGVCLISSDFLLIATGWDRFWGDPEYFGEFPVLEAETARWLVQFNLKGIGVDVISADAMHSTDFPVHRILLGKDMVIVENLKNLTAITGNTCSFSCLPLNLSEADGSPVRAVAFI
jgi:kynurenine formamidase